MPTLCHQYQHFAYVTRDIPAIETLFNVDYSKTPSPPKPPNSKYNNTGFSGPSPIHWKITHEIFMS